MACPTCGNEVDRWTALFGSWCARCGTLEVYGTATQEIRPHVPALAERCRVFLFGGKGEDGLGVLDADTHREAMEVAERLGIPECLTPTNASPRTT